MTQDVRIAAPDETLQHAAFIMGEIDAGMLPVGENDKLVGVVTDRDITIRGVGQGCQSDAKVGEIMSTKLLYCHDTDDVDDVLTNMADKKVRRLPVVDKDKRLVGIISLGDLAGKAPKELSGDALDKITRPDMSRAEGGASA